MSPLLPIDIRLRREECSSCWSALIIRVTHLLFEYRHVRPVITDPTTLDDIVIFKSAIDREHLIPAHLAL